MNNARNPLGKTKMRFSKKKKKKRSKMKTQDAKKLYPNAHLVSQVGET